MSSTEVILDESDVSTESIPTELQTRQRWVCWKNSGGGRRAVDPSSGEPLSSLDAESSLNEARHSFEEEGHDGVAFVVEPDGEYVGVRLSDAVEGPSYDPDIDDWADDIIQTVDSYAEIGPSGDDILVLTKGEIPDEEFESENIQFTSKGVLPVTGKDVKNAAVSPLRRRQKELEAVFTEYNQYESSKKTDVDRDIALDDVRETVVTNFDEDQWHVTETILSTHATLFIDGIQNCVGLLVVGESGAGKTTALRFFEGLDEQFYQSREVTPASFVSHDASLSEEQLQEVDLLPRIKHKTLLSPDMETWFSGDRESIRSTMSRMTHLMDGDGLTRDSGSHGQRGYEGDYRFSFIGASTPLVSRAWDVMGNAGYRFVFYHKMPQDDDEEKFKEDIFGESTYQERVDECSEVAQSFLIQLWDELDGYRGVSHDSIEVTEDVETAIYYLAMVVKFSRATLTQNSEGQSPEVSRENPRRIGAVLRDIAKGRALLDERTTVTVDDVKVSARIALSTMPKKRRPLVRALLNPSNGGQLSRNEAQEALGVSKPIALDRMELMEDLGIAEFTEVEDDGRGTKKLELKEEFQWPDILPFPDR